VLLRIEKTSLLRIRQLGLAGTVLIVLGGVLAGVPPTRDPVLRAPVLESLRAFTTPWVMVVFAGLALLLLAWWRLGAKIRGGHGPDVRYMLTTMAYWAAPLTVTMPIFSRDVYSYLAQGTMTVLGIDAYQYGPAVLGGPLSIDIPPIWQTTPAPYGPTFLSLAGDVTSVTGESTWLGIFGMRLLALGGLVLIAMALPRIARVCGVDPSAALWLGLLNPLVLIHLVGDAHNDSLMLGLMLSGIALALERRPVAGAALIALGALVKAPAGLALLFIVPIWAGQMSASAGRSSRWIRAAIGSFGMGAVTVVITTALAGTGYGWIGALDTPTLAHTWTSITTDVGYWSGLVVSGLGLGSADETLAIVRFLGLAAAGLSCLALLRRYHRTGPVVGLGLGLAVVLALGPVVHPWYLLWAIIPLAASATSQRIRRWVVVASVAMIVTVLPGGVQPTLGVFVGVLLGLGIVFGSAWIQNSRARGEWISDAWARGSGLAFVRGDLDRGAALGSAVASLRQMFQRQPVTVDAEATDDPERHGRDDRVVTKRFTRVDVRDVDLDERAAKR
jgi:hypothetical protein